MFRRSETTLTVALAGALALTLLAWASTIAATATRPSIFTSSIVSWKDAAVHKGDWGEMKIFFRGESFGTKDALAATAVVDPGKAVHRAHRHAEEEDLIVQEGKGKWSLNGKDVPAKKGDVLYVEPWVYHGLTNTGDKPLVFTVIRFSAKGISLPPRPDDGKDKM